MGDDSPVEGIFFSFLQANGIRHRVASNVRQLDRPRKLFSDNSNHGQHKPLIFLLHGFPESWYSWRHQLVALRDLSCVVVAPDMRGYGETSQPTSVNDYTQPVLAKDVVGIADYLGYNKFIVVGHDWGAMLAWSVALLYPEKVMGVFGLSIPYAGTPRKGLLTMLENAHGECIDPGLPRHILARAKFHYMLYHCLPRAHEEYDKNCEEFLYRMYAYQPGCQTVPGTPEYDLDGLMFPPSGNPTFDQVRVLDATAAIGLWKRIPRPTDLPAWMTAKDLNIFKEQYMNSGFRGGLLWYQAANLNFELMKELVKIDNGGHGDKILPPAMFLTGEDDDLVKFYGGPQKIEARLKKYLPNIILSSEPIFIPDCGHWIQQEKPEMVNRALMDFLARISVRTTSIDFPSTRSKL